MSALPDTCVCLPRCETSACTARKMDMAYLPGSVVTSWLFLIALSTVAVMCCFSAAMFLSSIAAACACTLETPMPSSLDADTSRDFCFFFLVARPESPSSTKASPPPPAGSGALRLLE